MIGASDALAEVFGEENHARMKAHIERVQSHRSAAEELFKKSK